MISDAFMTSPDRGCALAKVDTEFFFVSTPHNAPSAVKEKVRATRAKVRRLCRDHCPFTAQCFAWADETGQRHGIWGGVDMSYDKERRDARAALGLPDPAAQPEMPLIDRVLAGTSAFSPLDTDVQVDVVQAGLEQGLSFEQMAGRFEQPAEALQLLVGVEAETFDQQVARLYAAGKDDRSIGLTLGVHAKTVSSSRKRQGLATLYGPGGRYLSDAGRAQRENRLKQQDLLVRQGYDKGLTDEEIAEQTGLSVDRVTWTRRNRLALVSKHRAERVSEEVREQRKAEVRKLYEQGLSDAAIARQLGHAQSYVSTIRRNWLKLPPLFTSHGVPVKQAVPA